MASGASLAISVIGDWRDFDGDPVYVANSGLKTSAGTASVNSDGTIEYTAPQASRR